MKRVLIIGVFLMFCGSIYSQKYDLIVTASGDSIACKIDSISSDIIYFEIMLRNLWLKTNTPVVDVVDYEFDAIERRDVSFKDGTSYIESFKKADHIKSIKNIRRNSVFAELDFILLSVNYGRLIPVSDNFGLNIRAGVFWYDEFIPTGELSGYIGKTKHFVEPGIVMLGIDDLFFYKLGYVYQSPKGFLFKSFLLYVVGEEVWFGLALGYSF